MKILAKIYDGCKYTAESEVRHEVIYESVSRFEVVNGEDIDLNGMDTPDEYNEYLILHFENGDTATFRNSHVDIFNLH